MACKLNSNLQLHIFIFYQVNSENIKILKHGVNYYYLTGESWDLTDELEEKERFCRKQLLEKTLLKPRSPFLGAFNKSFDLCKTLLTRTGFARNPKNLLGFTFTQEFESAVVEY